MTIINIIIYITIILAIYMIFQHSINNKIKSIIRHIHRKRKKTELYEYIKKIYLSVQNISDEKQLESKIYGLYIKTAAIFLSVFIVIFRYNIMIYKTLYAICITVVPAIMLSLLPFVMLRIKLYYTQSNSSKEALIVTTEILNQYKIYNNNIVEAIDATIKNLENNIICKHYLMRLSMRIKEYQSDDELLDILDEFTFTVNTNWIRMLSDSIFFSMVNNIDITLSLDGLIEQIKAIDYTQNVGKRLNIEGFAMAKYLAPILYITLVIISVKVFDISLSDYLYYQFTSDGLKYFISIVIWSFICYICEYLYRKRKFDF
ncbi:hypothetical protein JYG23_12405 [Sedimentibacter sp. zth1]|uniref:hypothetical protein n=1 Tax=Sedimentibacter sp. zth1 TaxID=2816908 RepID=UPI001A91575E|nr:hypothetical protein [Sedimentibacter sp. zth1]QSX05470.1 hypothetical protein JYG23_12405 [Sedimentibacter sp. zth1]